MTEGDTLQQILTDTRRRFIASFDAQSDSIRLLVEQVASFGPQGPVAALTHLVHRLAGLAGTIGFPTVSIRASELEALVSRAGPFDAVEGRGLAEAIREAYARDFANPPEWAMPARTTLKQTAKILVAEDESDQRSIVKACLEHAGYATIIVISGDRVVEAARAEKPALILLDIAMPGLDGYSACRLLKADPELAGIPVIFLTASGSLDNRLAGLALGADEFLTKPVDLRELMLRIQLVIERNRERREAPASDGLGKARELTYDAFVAVASEEIGRSPAAFAMVRLPTDRHGEVAVLLAQELRGRDSIGTYDLTRMLILLPDMTAAVARERLEPLVVRLTAHGLPGICIGVTADDGGTKTAETLIGEADEALAEARYMGHNTAIWSDRHGRALAVPAGRSVLIADDDPDAVAIIDSQLRAAGYTVFVAFDGVVALAAARTHAPDVLVLDLMMPKLDGFEVLRALREGPEPRPRVIVLSGREREQDVRRAFALGADDYLTKPFNHRELVTRIAQVLK